MLKDKKITRKEFIFSALSIGAVIFASKVPEIVKTFNSNKKKSNSYGNYSYGGIKKNA
jgi:hypothetical protein